VESEGTAAIVVKMQEGMTDTTKIMAKARRYAVTKNSEADKLYEMAKAEGQRKRSEALAYAGENYVALQAAEKLYGKFAGGLLVGVNPTDVDEMAKLFGAKKPQQAYTQTPQGGAK
jgi:hypothetical protein